MSVFVFDPCIGLISAVRVYALRHQSIVLGQNMEKSRNWVCPGVRVNEGIAIVVSLFRSHCFISFLL